jgi:hypothetical protein
MFRIKAIYAVRTAVRSEAGGAHMTISIESLQSWRGRVSIPERYLRERASIIQA